MGRGNVRAFFPVARATETHRFSTDVDLDTLEKDHTTMLIKRSACPVTAKGRQGATVPTVAIRDNGQLAFNSKAWEHFPEGTKYLAVGLDDKTRVLTLQGLANVPAKTDVNDLFPVSANKKGGGGFAAFSSALKHEDVNYNYRESGNQVFDVTMGKNGILSIVLPSGSLPAKPKQHRVRKAKGAAASASASASPATPGTPTLLDVE